jgi:hypothetical protein
MSAKNVEIVTESRTESFIALNKLKKSPKNARKKPHREASIEAYAASIAAKGILQNLVVEPELDADGAATGFYFVTIGEGRRLAQLYVSNARRSKSPTFEAWKKHARPSMRQTRIGGEKVFVDFAGDTIDIFDPITGEVRAMRLFVAAMGDSNYTYAEACPSESLSDWIGVHANLFRYLGGVPKFVVCDNLKAAVTNPDRYDPGINRTYAEMAGHYGTAILAARPRRPKHQPANHVAFARADQGAIRLSRPSFLIAQSQKGHPNLKPGAEGPDGTDSSPSEPPPTQGHD